MGGRSTRWSTGVWLLACVGLAGVTVLELTVSMRFSPEVVAAPPPSATLDAELEPLAFEPPPPDVLDDIAGRPLFSKSRRPFEPPETGPDQAEPPPIDQAMDIQLIGTILANEDRAALLELPGEKARWLRQGQDVRGWRVEEIERDWVLLGRDDRVERLELRADQVRPRRPRKVVTKGEPAQKPVSDDQTQAEPARGKSPQEPNQ